MSKQFIPSQCDWRNQLIFFSCEVYVHNFNTSRKTGDELGLMPNLVLWQTLWRETDMAAGRSENLEEGCQPPRVFKY